MDRKPSSRIADADAGSLLVDWLAGKFSYLSRELWASMILEGRVRVDGAVVPCGWELKKGQRVSFDPPEYPEPEIDADYRVVYEDEDFLIVDKSGNIPCHPTANGRYYRHSLWRILGQRFGEVRIATRLDRETSGLVLACRSSEAASYAGKLLAKGRVRKEYLALVYGSFPSAMEAEGRLEADEASEIRLKRRYLPGPPSGPGEEACSTSFESLGSFAMRIAGGPEEVISLVKAVPKTGRRHQIRATLFSLGFPLVGDKLYGRDEKLFLRQLEGILKDEDLTRLVLPNQALHCATLSFASPSGKAIEAASCPRWGTYIDEGLARSLGLAPQD